MTTVVTFVRRARTLLWTALSISIIFCAVIVGLGKLFLPYTAQYQGQLESWLSGEFGRPVEVESFSGEWKAFGPQLALKGLMLKATDGGTGTSVIEEAVIDIKPFNALIPSRALYNFRVVGANFHLIRLQDGSFDFYGLGVGGGEAGSGESGLRQLAKISEVILEDSSLKYDDEIHQINLNIREINGRLRVRGDELSAEISSRLAHVETGEVYGEFEATARIMMDGDDGPLSARWQLSGQEMMLNALRDRLPPNDYFPQQGRFNTEMWGDWEREDKHRIRGVIDLRDARLVNADLDRSVERMNTRFSAEFDDPDKWRMDLAGFVFNDGESEMSVNSLALGRDLAAGAGLWVSADALPVGLPAEIAVDVVRIIGKEWPRYIPKSGEGIVRDFEMVLNSNMKLGTATGSFRRASVSNWDIWPDIRNLDGRLEFGPGTGALILNGKGVVVEWPRMFSAPLTVDMPSCRVNFSWVSGVKGQYQVGINQCAVENEFVSATGDMNFRGNTGKPAVDVVVYADRLNAGAVGDYWPRDLLKPKVTDWLKTGLLSGELESGRLQIFGDMDHWPFDHGQGRFETIARVRNAEIAYFEDWPHASGVDGTARFVNSSMDISGRVGDIAGVEAQSIRARIDDFRIPELQLDYQSDSDLPGILAFLEQTPIREKVGADLDEFGFEGAARTSGKLVVPLSKGSTGIDLEGILELQENVFNAPELDFSLTGIGGVVNYHQFGFHGEYLEAQYKGKSAALEVQAGGDPDETEAGSGASDKQAPAGFNAQLIGMFEVRDLIPERLLATWSPLSKIEGSSLWKASFSAGGDSVSEITLSSDLRGTAMHLPKPLQKAAGEQWPFELRFPLQGDTKNLQIVLEERLSTNLLLGEGWTAPQSGVIRFGDGEVELPANGRLTISGRSESVDLDGWIGLVIEQAREGRDLGGLTLESGTLTGEEVLFIDRRFENVTMSFSAEAGLLNVDFDGEAIDGNVTFIGLAGGNQSLNAEFERLVLDEPLKTGMEMDVDPAGLPALHLYVESFRYSGVELGATRIEAYPTAEGFHFEKVEAESPHLNLRASGDWSLEEGAHRSSFDIHMTSESLGDFLRQLKIASPVEGGQTLVRFEVWWNGAPGQFKLARLNGDVNFNVNTGVIKNASPGTGRLLGLLSIQALPRRLALDFRDVFDSGFAFDEANGSFRMLNGSARTDDVTLKSSAARISFSGTTDLVAKEYDQLITVRPGLGNTLPVIGAIAGGPGGAAAGLALQGLLHDELGEASQVQYTLTGAWAEPQIEPVLKSESDG